MRAGLAIKNWLHHLFEDDPRRGATQDGASAAYELKVVGSCVAIGIAYVSLLFWLASLANR